MPTSERRPRTLWQIFEIVDGKIAACRDMPHLYKEPNDLAPAVGDMSAAGRDVCIWPVSFTAGEAIAAIRRGASPRQIAGITDWPAEDVACIAATADALGPLEDGS